MGNNSLAGQVSFFFPGANSKMVSTSVVMLCGSDPIPTADRTPTPSECMMPSRERMSAESSGLPHREVTDGLRRPLPFLGGRRNPSVTSSRFLVAKGDFRPASIIAPDRLHHFRVSIYDQGMICKVWPFDRQAETSEREGMPERERAHTSAKTEEKERERGGEKERERDGA